MTTDPPLPRQLVVEGLATLVLILFGLGGAVQVGTGAEGAIGDHGDMAWAWGIGVMVAVYVGARGSGAHLNPAVTIALAAFGRFEWRKVPGYVTAQCVGAFLGAGTVVIGYRDLLRNFDPGKTMASQLLLVTAPGNGIAPVSVTSAFIDQVIGTAILLLAIFALITVANDPPLANLEPYMVGVVVVGIDMSWGALGGAPINPARDFAPRLVLALAGYDTAWSDHTGYPYFWVPIVGSVAGGLLGAAVFHYGVQPVLPAAGSDTGSASAAPATPVPHSPLSTQVAALATSFAIDFLTWDEDDPHARGVELAKYFPSASPAALTQFGGWSGRGRQEVVEPLFSPTVTANRDGRRFHITQPVKVVTYRRGPDGQTWQVSGVDTPSLSFTIQVQADRLQVAPANPPATATGNGPAAVGVPAPPIPARGDGGWSAGAAGWLDPPPPAPNGSPTHGHDGDGHDEPAATVLHSYAVRGTLRSAP